LAAVADARSASTVTVSGRDTVDTASHASLSATSASATAADASVYIKTSNIVCKKVL